MTYVYTVTYLISLNQDISLHSNTYQKMQANENLFWKYKRYYMVMEYEQKPPLVPPFIIIYHVLCFCRWLKNCLGRGDEHGQNGLNSGKSSKNVIINDNYSIITKEV